MVSIHSLTAQSCALRQELAFTSKAEEYLCSYTHAMNLHFKYGKSGKPRLAWSHTLECGIQDHMPSFMVFIGLFCVHALG